MKNVLSNDNNRWNSCNLFFSLSIIYHLNSIHARAGTVVCRRKTGKVCKTIHLLNRYFICIAQSNDEIFNFSFLLPRICDGRKSEFPTKKAVRPFSQYAYDIKFKHGRTEKENFGFAADNDNKIDNKTLVNGGHGAQTWYRDVVELRKKAEEYKVCV